MIPLVRLSFEEIQILGLIDEGAYAKVYKGVWNGKMVAVKEMPHSKKNQFLFKREVNIHKKMVHPNIAEFFGICIDRTRLWIVMEYVEGGSLAALLRDPTRYQSVTLQQRLQLIKDIANALAYMHSLSPPTIHRDIKAENILIDIYGRAKLCDFGMAEQQLYGKRLSPGARGTPLWSPPEVLTQQDADEKVDVYSFGLVCWSICAGTEPFSEFTDYTSFVQAVCNDNLRPPVSDLTPSSVNQLMKLCWASSSHNRPSFSAIQVQMDHILQEQMVA